MELRLESTKNVDNKRVNIYKIGRYTVRQTVYQDSSFYVEVRAKRDDYLPAIYAREDLQCNVTGFEIQTTSYGALSAEETKKMIAALNEAIEVVEILTAKFVKFWTIKYLENGTEKTMTVFGTPKDTEKALEKIKAKGFVVTNLENSEGRKYYPMVNAQ